MNGRIIFEDLGSKNYKDTREYQETFFNALVDRKKNKEKKDAVSLMRIIFVEHPHVYTLGKSGSEANLLINSVKMKAENIDFFHTNRGGDITYHGPGQITGYPILDLEVLGLSLKEYIHKLEESVIKAIKTYGITGERLPNATGVWVKNTKNQPASKICAIGVRASRYITMHGFALNINTDLKYFDYINPCGFTDKKATSVAKETGRKIPFDEAKEVMRSSLESEFAIETCII